ncbi:MAG: hypothetical protein Q7S43_05220 [bacterium]|nr:hypothetical protein [bacterium]
MLFLTPERDRAWALQKNADYMQHQRHTIFLLAQTFLFLGIASQPNPPQIRYVLAAFGSVLAVLWCIVANRLEKYMDKMRKVMEGDPVFDEYDKAVGRRDPLGGRLVFNFYLPISTFSHGSPLFGSCP